MRQKVFKKKKRRGGVPVMRNRHEIKIKTK